MTDVRLWNVINTHYTPNDLSLHCCVDLLLCLTFDPGGGVKPCICVYMCFNVRFHNLYVRVTGFVITERVKDSDSNMRGTSKMGEMQLDHR